MNKLSARYGLRAVAAVFSFVALAACAPIVSVGGAQGEGGSGGDGGGGTPPPILTTGQGSAGAGAGGGDGGTSEGGSSSAGGSSGEGGSTNPCDPCSAFEIADAGQYPYGLVQDDAFLYWTNYSPATIRRIPKAGGPVEILAGPGSGTATFLDLDATHVYWTNGDLGQVLRVAKAGGAPEILASSQPHATGIKVDDTFAYFTNFYDALKRVPKAGGSPQQIASIDSTRALALTQDDVYWAVDGQAVWSMSKAGGAPTELDPFGPYCITADASNLYYTSSVYGFGGIYQMPLGGSEADIAYLAPAEMPFGLTTDATHLYWADAGTHTLNKIPIGGGPTTILYASLGDSRGIVVDDTSVYWVDYNDGKLRRTAK